MKTRTNNVDFDAKANEIQAYLDQDSPSAEYVSSLSDWYVALGPKQKKLLFHQNNAYDILQTIEKALGKSKTKEINMWKDFSHEIDSVLKMLNKYIASPQPDYTNKDFAVLRAWYKGNKEFEKFSYGSEHHKDFASILLNARIVFFNAEFDRLLSEKKYGPKYDDAIYKIHKWYEDNNADILSAYERRDERAILFAAKLANVLIMHAEMIVKNAETQDHAKKEDRKTVASSIIDNALDVLQNIPRDIRLSVNVPGRKLINAAYASLGAELEKRYVSFHGAQEKKDDMRTQAGLIYLMEIRTRKEIEAYDHFALIAKYEADLPSSGLCNAFTSEAIRFYEKHDRDSESFITKMTGKTYSSKKPESFLNRMNVLQEHDVSSSDVSRKSGLPKYKDCIKALGKYYSVEILTDLTTAIKHSLLFRVTRDAKHEITQIHLIDSTIGEAHFSNTDEGRADFDKTMQQLHKAYSLVYGDIKYAFVQKSKLLFENESLLFKSSKDQETPDMTFKEKTHRPKKNN